MADDASGNAANPQARLAPPPFRPFTEDDLAVAKLHPKCIVENYLYADLGIVCAAGGTGKTTTLIYEAVCIALGHEVWGLPVIHPGATLFITAEDSRDLFAARLREILNAMRLTDNARQHALNHITVWDVSSQMTRLAQLDQSGNIQLTPLADDIVAAYQDSHLVQIVFDPAISFGPGERMVNDGEQAVVIACRRIIRGLNCAVRLIAHTGKANARNGAIDQYAGRGGSAFPDGCRMVTILSSARDSMLTPPDAVELKQGDSGFVLARAKLSYTPPQPNIWIRRNGFTFEHFTEQPNNPDETLKRDADKVEQFIREELTHGRKYTANTLDSAVGKLKIPRKRVRSALAHLDVAGRVIVCELPKEERIGQRKAYLKPMIHSAKGHGGIEAKNPVSEASEQVIPPPSIIPPPYRERKDGGIERPLSFSGSLNPPNLDGGIAAEWRDSHDEPKTDGLDGRENRTSLIQSPVARRILECLNGDLAGMTEDAVISACGGKAGAALTRDAINALLLAGQINRVNNRLVGSSNGR